MPVSTPKPPHTPTGQGRHSGYFSVPCAGYKGSWSCWIRFSKELLQSDPEIKSWRTDCQDGWTADLGIFTNGCISGDMGSSSLLSTVHQPGKQQWTQAQNCHPQAETGENPGTTLRSETSSPLRWPRHKTALPHNTSQGVWGKPDQTGKWTYWTIMQSETEVTTWCLKTHHPPSTAPPACKESLKNKTQKRKTLGFGFQVWVWEFGGHMQYHMNLWSLIQEFEKFHILKAVLTF